MNARIEAFLQYIRYEKNYSELTMQSYRQDLLQYEDFVTSQSGTFDPLQLDLDLVRAWMADMARHHAATTSIKRRLCALRSFYKYLRRLKLIESDLFTLLPSPKVPKPLPIFVREEQMETVLDDEDYGEDFEGLRDRLLIDFLYSTGVRRMEAARLKDGDIDFGAGTIRILGKGNKQRDIPFGRELNDLMQKYLAARMQEIGGRTEYFFVTSTGEALGVSRIYTTVRKHLAGIPNLDKRSPHVLRHTFATNMLSNGADLMAVKDLLGHSSLESTEVYTHVTPQEIMASYKQAHPRANNDKKKGD